MKKLIAILATTIAAGGFSAFAQDWVTVQQSGNGIVYDLFTTPGSSHEAPAGDVTVECLWATSGATDPLAGTGTTTGSAAPSQATIASMLSGSWTLMQDYANGGGTASLGTVSTTTGGTVSKGGSIVAYNGGPFEFDTTTAVASGSSIQFIWLAFAGGSDYSTAMDLGVSGDSTVTVGTTVGDPNATSPEVAGAFGVAPVPEPTTLALAGLGGLSMLGLRRRKA